jgi:DNA-binding beta-propeller fold protein YncE
MMLGGPRPLALATSLLGLVLVAGCSGGGSASKTTPSVSTPNSGSGSPSSSERVLVAISFTVPDATSTSATSRSPQFISSGINSGIASALQFQGGTWTPVAAQVYDLSAGSSSCTAPASTVRRPETNPGRTCTIFLPAPVGTDQFELDTYNGIVGSGGNCTTSATVTSSCSLGSELSSGVALGSGGNGFTVSSGSSTSVTLTLQALISSIVPTGLYTSTISTSTGSSASGPSFSNPAFVVGATTNNSSQFAAVCWSNSNGRVQAACTGTQNRDAAGINITQSTATCSDLSNSWQTPFQLFPATLGGNINDLTVGSAVIDYQACDFAGTGNNLITVTAGAGPPQSSTASEIVLKPSALIEFNYTGGGGGGDQSTTAPFWAAALNTTSGFPDSVNVPSASSPQQLSTNPQVITGAVTASKSVSYILAPLYAVVKDAAALGGTQRESAGSNTVTLNLNGPDGYTAMLWAAQAAVPSNQTSAGYTITQPPGCNGVFTLGARVTNSGAAKWGAMWPITGGGTAASGSTCTILIHDNDTNFVGASNDHSVAVIITNTVGAGGTISFATPTPAQNLYVANYNNNTVTVYAANPSGNVTSAPLATIGGGSTGINFPVGVALDASGKIYVANNSNNTVTVYAANPSGNVTSAPLATIGGGSTGINSPRGVALDASGKIYVANEGNSTVTVYAANPSGNVTSAPLATIGGGSTGINFPLGVALDASGKIYVANEGNNTVLVFAANPSGNVTGNPLATIGGGSTGINTPAGVALDASGKIYVANEGNNNVLVFAANPSGNVTGNPLATIGGGGTGINGPFGVALDASGQIYVANFSNNNVLVFAANPSGNVTGAPLATYGGGSTGISAPFGVAIR